MTFRNILERQTPLTNCLTSKHRVEENVRKIREVEKQNFSN